MANSVLAHGGHVVAAIGGIVGARRERGTGDTERGAAVTLLAAGVCYVAAGLVAARMRQGPARPGPRAGPARGRRRHRAELRDRRGAAWWPAAALRPGAAGAAAAPWRATGGSRFCYGILILMSILLYRNYFYRGARRSTALEAHYRLPGRRRGRRLRLLAALRHAARSTRRLTKPTWIIALAARRGRGGSTGVLGQTFDQVGLPGHRLLPRPGRGRAWRSARPRSCRRRCADAYRGRVFSFYDMTVQRHVRGRRVPVAARSCRRTAGHRR